MAKTPIKSSDKAAKPQEYQYVLDWIKESAEARTKQNAYVSRALEAYKGAPSKNRYAGTIEQYAQSVSKHDMERAKQIREAFRDVPAKGSMVVHDAVEAIVSMAQGGVGQYEFGPYDPDMRDDDTITDRLASAAKHFYITEKIDSVVPRYIRASVLTGIAHLHLKQKGDRTLVTILDSSQMITDPKRYKTNYDRFIGHHQRESLREVKSSIIKRGSGYMLKTLNEAEVYVSQIRDMLNNVNSASPVEDRLNTELKKDIDLFYKNLPGTIEQRKKDDPQYAYDGDEIELSYIYDLMNDMEFEVVNRKYIISARKKRFSRDIKVEYYNAAGAKKTKNKTISIDHPYIPLPCVETYWDRFPVTPLFYLLDDFDDLCAMESVLFHNLSIMAPITFVGQSSDAEKVSRVASVAGEVVEGLPQTFGTLAKAHDITPVVTAINRYEEKIKRTMNAVDPFALQAMIGDRATAKEVVSTSASVSQGLNSFIANIETAMATLGDKVLKMQVIYNAGKTYSFTHNGKYAEIEAQEVASDYEVRAKLVSSIKMEQEANSRKAIELIQSLGGSEAVKKDEFLGTMIPIAIGGLVTREQAKNMVADEYRPMPEEVIATIRKQEEARARMDPIDKLDLSDFNDDDLMTTATQASNVASAPEVNFFPDETLPTELPPTTPPVADAEEAGVIANDPTSQGYSF